MLDCGVKNRRAGRRTKKSAEVASTHLEVTRLIPGPTGTSGWNRLLASPIWAQHAR
jgi:hypothetical protein